MKKEYYADTKYGILIRHVILIHFKSYFLTLLNSICKDVFFKFVITKQRFDTHLHK